MYAFTIERSKRPGESRVLWFAEGVGELYSGVPEFMS